MRRTHVHRFLGLTAAGLAALGLVVAAPADAAKHATAKEKGKSYAAPFKPGPQGGDAFSYSSADSDGTVTVGRIYPIPGAINCTKGGPYAKLLVTHKAGAPVRKVVVSYDSAAVDNFTFAMVGLRDTKGHWYGTKTVRGFVEGSGDITLVPDAQRGHHGPLVVEFGLQQSSACPNADAGTIKYTTVLVLSGPVVVP
jgi:hypothetical protein